MGGEQRDHRPPQLSAVLQQFAEVVQRDGEVHEYKSTKLLAEKLTAIATQLSTNVADATTATDTTLTSDKDLLQQVLDLIGDAEHQTGIKKLDVQAHELRGNLQAKHQWTTDVLEDIIADFQKKDTATLGTPAPKAAAYVATVDRADNTGLDATPVATKTATPWEVLIAPGSGAQTSGSGGGGSTTPSPGPAPGPEDDSLLNIALDLNDNKVLGQDGEACCSCKANSKITSEYWTWSSSGTCYLCAENGQKKEDLKDGDIIECVQVVREGQCKMKNSRKDHFLGGDECAKMCQQHITSKGDQHKQHFAGQCGITQP